MKMSPKVKKEAPAPPKAKAKIKALKTKKGYWKVSTAQKKKKEEDLDVTHLSAAQNTLAQEAAQRSWEEGPQEKQT